MSTNGKLEIVKKGRDISIRLNGSPVDLNYLTRVNLDMEIEGWNVLTLEYVVRDVDIQTDRVEIDKKVVRHGKEVHDD